MYRILLPKNLNKITIREVVIEFRKYIESFPKGSELGIDMTLIQFIEPAGVISLNNIIQWSRAHKDIEVSFLVDTATTNSKNRGVMEYLSDCGFFANFNQADIFKLPSLRSTTLEVKTVETKRINQWKQSDLMSWLQRCTGTKNQFSSVCVAIDEIFNNISDHSTEKIGSIFGQFFPKNNTIKIAVSDFGIGIPKSIEDKFSLHQTDNKLIEYALQEGVSSQSVPQNRGAGLSNIMRSLTINKIGRVTIISNCGIVEVSDEKIVRSEALTESYPGTFFELEFDISNPHLYDSEEEEEFEW